MVISTVLVAVSVIVDAETSWHQGYLRRPGGLLANRNYAGEYLAICLPVCLMMLRRRALPLLLLVGFALALTRCRTAWIVAGVGLATLAFAAWVFARLGGWTGYYGKPGPIVMLKGWLRIQDAKHTAAILARRPDV